jgi:hypothetical protein
VFLLELGLGFGLVGRAAQDDRILAGESVAGVTKLVRLGGSPGGVGLGEEIKDNVLAREVAEADS